METGWPRRSPRPAARTRAATVTTRKHRPALPVAPHEEARQALGAYWTALEGTLDPAKVEKAADNAIVGNAEEIADQLTSRFPPDDRLMLWFDFFNHDNDRVIRNMRAFMAKVAPRAT